MIRVTGLRKRFGDSEILKGIDFEVPPQTVLGVIGASGSGKTTLLRCLNGLETISDGTIECDNVRLEAGLSHADYRRRVKELRLKVGTVFQHFYLFPHLSVVGNIIEAPVHVLRTPKKQAETEAYELLESVGLRQAARRYPESLSGGEQQRVAIARALAMHPALLLLDEPTSALDPLTEARVHERLAGTFPGACIVASVHRMSLLAHFDRVVLMAEGRIVDTGSVEELRGRQPAFAAMLAGGMHAAAPATAEAAETAAAD
jgi:ABC-type polar amino acid transport system ATPase subunit